jgi:predicted metal-dependent hydrolase
MHIEACKENLHPFAIMGLAAFNKGDYFLAHEFLEDAWKNDLTDRRDLYQGVLQIAVAYYHIENLNYRGTLKMLQRSRKWLDPLPDTCRGIDVAKLRSDALNIYKLLIDMGPEQIGVISSESMKPIDWESG